MPRVLQQRVAQAAAQLAEAAPMVLILAFDHNGSTMIPLEAAAKNEDFGVELRASTLQKQKRTPRRRNVCLYLFDAVI